MVIRRDSVTSRVDLAVAGIVLLLVALCSGTARAQIDPVVQPHGVPVTGLLGDGAPTQAQTPITNGAEANAYTGIPDPTKPFDETQPAGVVRTTDQTEYYVRLYTPPGPPGSNPNGPWIMRASTVRGLTPEQLRDRFALPFLPTMITNVLVPSGTCLLTGVAGPITGNFPADPPNIPSAGPWGNGGAQQTRLIAHDPTPGCRFDFLPSTGADNA